MTSFSRFQQRNKQRTVAQNNLNTNFIFKGYPSTKISGSTGESIQASVVNKQERDYAYVFTQMQDELKVGSIWTVKNLKLLITEEITIIKDVNWHKYHALLCNVQVDNLWGYFKGPEKSFLDVSLEQKVVWESPQKPVLVLPESTLGFMDKIVIKGRAWLVQEYDAISTPGLVYYSLKPTTISKDVAAENAGKDVYVDKHEETMVTIIEEPIAARGVDLPNMISANKEIYLSTEEGYFKTSNKNIKIKKRSSSEVVFVIPYGIAELTVEVKEKGEIVKKLYRVV